MYTPSAKGCRLWRKPIKVLRCANRSQYQDPMPAYAKLCLYSHPIVLILKQVYFNKFSLICIISYPICHNVVLGSSSYPVGLKPIPPNYVILYYGNDSRSSRDHYLFPNIHDKLVMPSIQNHPFQCNRTTILLIPL